MAISGIKYGVIIGAAAGEGANNHMCMTFHTWGNSVWNSKEVMRLTSRGRLGILLEWWNIFSIFVMTIRHEK